MGRRRSRSRASWPDNLYPNRGGFKYRNPRTRKEHWLGRDQARAFAAARKLNDLLIREPDLYSRVAGTDKSIADAIDLFLEEDVPKRGWAPSTKSTYCSVLNRIRKAHGDLPIDSVSVRDCAEFVRGATTSPRARQQFRLVWMWILACAVEDGWIESNPALQIRKPAYKPVRERLDLESYQAIWRAAEPWLRNAMDIGLLTLLRREDISMLRFDDVFDDVFDGALHVVQSKTKGSTGVRLRIAVTDDLQTVIGSCRDAVASPFLIHRLPERLLAKEKRAARRTHHTQVLPDQLTDEFQEARERAGVGGDHPRLFMRFAA